VGCLLYFWQELHKILDVHTFHIINNFAATTKNCGFLNNTLLFGEKRSKNVIYQLFKGLCVILV